MDSKIVKKERILWMDILNIVATLGVILLHCSNGPVHNWDGIFNMSYIFGMFTHTIVLWPVCIFLMLSGCNLIDYNNSHGGGWKSFYIRRFRRIGVPFLAWSLFYAVIFIITHLDEPLRWQEYITMFINGKFNGHMWFFVSLFAFYLTIPFLSVFFKHAPNGTIKWLVYFSFLFNSLLPFIFGLFGIDYFNGTVYYGGNIFPLGTNLLIYGCMGYILIKTKVFTNTRLYYRLAILSAILHFTGMIIVMNVINGSERAFNYTSPTCFFMSIAVFLWFKNQDWHIIISRLHLTPELFHKLSSCSFGIYLLHGFVLSFIRHFGFGLDNRYFGFLIIYVITLVCILIMKRMSVIRDIVP